MAWQGFLRHLGSLLKVSTDVSAFLLLLERAEVSYQLCVTCASATHRLQLCRGVSGAALLWAWAAELGELKTNFHGMGVFLVKLTPRICS